VKSRKFTWAAALTFLAALALPLHLAAQKHPRYAVTDLGTLGGTFSVAFGLNNQGWVDGGATLPGDTARHAFLWRNGQMTDLGTLGGPNSLAFVGNERGQIVGQAETATPDPNGEDFCGFGTHLTCLPFLWQHGVISTLPTLGGNNAASFDINNQGQVAGIAENATLDSTCPGSAFQAEAVIWEKGGIRELPTVSGDPDGYVNWINDKGQAVGGSGNCLSASPSLHALLWQNGTPTDLGNLGGTLFSGANAINDLDQIIGSSDLRGDTNFWAFPFINNHAFLWQNGAITDLGTLPGDATSFANAINNKGQAVGNGSRAILWHGGGLTDLNTLVAGPPFSPLYLLSADDINDRGEIVGLGLAINGELHAFRAVPCDDDHADIERCKDNAGVSAAEELIQPMAVTDSPDAPTRANPTLNGRRREMLNKPGIRRFPGHSFPTPRTGPMH
jgi:probable HAF family extracellular repeat protein